MRKVSGRLKTTVRGVMASRTRVSRNNNRFFRITVSFWASSPSFALSSAMAAKFFTAKPA